ncbi:MAG TPA: SBBP repeat-containing protein, partial [Blastocatellia bacterium]|nr:SBBP repeat-containing protein [Blastocatellia bacterium]
MTSKLQRTRSFIPGKRRRQSAGLGMLLLTVFMLVSVPAGRSPLPESRAASVADTGANEARSRLAQTFGRLPLSFETNAGQVHSAAKFIARGPGYHLALADNEASIALQKSAGQSAILKMRLTGANPHARLTGLEPLPGKSNYFIGNDPRRWQTNVAQYARVKHEAVYSGIDLIYYGNQQELEYDFVVQPGADVAAISLNFEGAEQIRVAENGDLVLRVAGEEVRQKAPVIYQQINGEKHFVKGRYALSGRKQIGFKIETYDRRQPLVIDPVLSYATYLGGSSQTSFGNITLDAAGNILLCGTTLSLGPMQATPGAFQTQPNGFGMDGCIVKLNPTGTAILFATYLGGPGGDGETGVDWCNDVAVDATGNIYATGVTGSTAFPIKNGFQSALRRVPGTAVQNAFIAKLNSQGSQLLYSTYFADAIHGNQTRGNALALVGSKVYVTGETNLLEDPTLNLLKNAYLLVVDTDKQGASSQVFLRNLRGAWAKKVVVDAAGKAYLTGHADAEFSTTNSPVAQTANRIFIAKLDPDKSPASAIVYASTVGIDPVIDPAHIASGIPPISIGGLAIDAGGNVFAAGTLRGVIPTTPDAFQTGFNNASCSYCSDSFVMKFNPGGTLVYSSYVGGERNDDVGDLLLTGPNQITIVGATTSNNFPVTTDAIQGQLNGFRNAFITKLDLNRAGNSALLFSTYLGGAGSDSAGAATQDTAGNLWLIGSAQSLDFPTTPNALQMTRMNAGNAYLAKIGFGGTTEPPVSTAVNVSSASYAGAVLSPESIVTAFGNKLAGSVMSASGALPTELAGTKVRVTDSAGTERLASLFFVSPTQINYLLPAGTALGEATITISSASGDLSRE